MTDSLPTFQVGDRVRIDFCGREGEIISPPVPVLVNGGRDTEYHVGLRWQDGNVSPSYNTDYLELVYGMR